MLKLMVLGVFMELLLTCQLLINYLNRLAFICFIKVLI